MQIACQLFAVLCKVLIESLKLYFSVIRQKRHFYKNVKVPLLFYKFV